MRDGAAPPHGARGDERLCALALVLAVSVVACGERRLGLEKEGARPGTAVVVHSQAPAASAFRAAVQAVLPALVFVQVEAVPARGTLGTPFPPFGGERQGRPGVGSGSGFVLTPDGLILTNNHVVENARVVTVVLSDNRRLEAAVVGRDPDTDIAVLQVEAEGLEAASLGDSDSIQVGDWVLALGFPLGLSATVTAGIVSATGRSLGILREGPEAVAPLEHFIQTDAAINRGNSGGPMVDLAGRVVGVNSAIASPTGYYTGYGFAIPINIARRVAEDIVRYGEVHRPRLGALIADVVPADAAVYGLPAVAGAEVVGVDPQGPAADAGVELGDVVLAVDSVPVRTSGDLLAALARRRPGETVRLQAVRYGRRIEHTVTLGRLPSRVGPPQPPTRREGTANLGFAIAGIPQGVVVSQVDRYSAAVRAGVRPGQRIVAVNGRRVRTTAEFEEVLRSLQPPLIISLRVVDPDLGETIINYEPEPVRRAR